MYIDIDRRRFSKSSGYSWCGWATRIMTVSHIKGLLINFLHSFWPSLLKVPSFLVEFITPIAKATHRNGTVLSFYSMPEYESWKGSLAGNASSWSIKYYKTSKEGKAYFQSLDKHKKDFIWMDEQDGDAIELAFSKNEDRSKEKLASAVRAWHSPRSEPEAHKPGQRKILFCSFKRNFVKEAKVSQFSGYVSEHSAYHHGEQSLASTIIGMAQDFVGSNNINLLLPNGQFDTRIVGGKDHASSRYIYTQLSPITRFLFPKDDDGLLDYLDEDGQTIERNWYMPIIPMVLVNGCEGIGTGWSTFIPNYNPRDVVANIRRLLNGEMMEPMNPWYRGFKGTIEKGASKNAGCSYTVNGVINEVNETTLRVTELPVRRWTDDYRAFLNSVTEGNRDENGNLPKDPFVKDFRKYGDDAAVVFEVQLSEENMMAAKQEGLLKKFKLTTSISTSNMHLFDSAGVIKKYDNPEQILEEFFHLRLEYYEKRKKVLLENLEFELLKLENKVRKVLPPIPKKSKAVVAGATDDKEEAEDNPDVSGVDILRKTTPTALWVKDLEALEMQLDALDKYDAEAEEARRKLKGDAGGEAGLKVSKQAPKNPRKYTKKAINEEVCVETMRKSSSSAMEKDQQGENVTEVVKPKGRAGSRKAPAKKEKPSPLMDEDDEIESLKDRLDAYRLDSSPERSADMETDVLRVPAVGETLLGRSLEQQLFQ
ncbi:hypothetical protein OIU84_025461 [Salix udensis]|uniref:DNA topoisomerase (ATP-hydrolyzing) n=1 Tax=Salix udensis TaxID=889485 RepID=A0AAD6KLW7_9ROSI|nr:hypothetical protein OIU84_025461 [Salix udensis]